MNPLLAEVIDQQLRSLKWIYAVMGASVLGMFTATLILGPPEWMGLNPEILLWTELGLLFLGALLLGLALPIVRARLLDPARVRRLPAKTLAAWGLPDRIDERLGRQAVFLTRYTAGCVVSWGLAAASGLYGLVARMLGASAPVAGVLLAAAVFVLVLLPPHSKWLRETVENL